MYSTNYITDAILENAELTEQWLEFALMLEEASELPGAELALMEAIHYEEWKLCWQERLISQEQIEPMKPTRENAKAHQSKEKTMFESLGLEDRISYDTVSVPLGGNVVIYFKFRVTSLEAYVSVRLTEENAGCDLPPNGNYRSSANLGDFVTIGEFGWGENGSGFNKKFEKALEYCYSIASGDWSSVRPLVQENRTVSYSPRTGESRTRFSCPETSSPELAKKSMAFPLPLPF